MDEKKERKKKVQLGKWKKHISTMGIPKSFRSVITMRRNIVSKAQTNMN